MERSSAMDLSLRELVDTIQARALTPLQSVQAALDRIELLNPSINAFVLVCRDQAIREAETQTEAMARGENPGLLAGVPVGVKDLEDVAGLPTSFGAEPFKDFIASADSPHIARLREKGAIIVGKTNTPIFGSTAFCKNRLYGTTRNPWDLSKTPGGSSGGSAAAVAARMVPVCTAADGGGSIRIPGCFTGTFALKPTFGRVPMTEGDSLGLTKFVDCVHFGCITRTVLDTALYLDAVVGEHWKDKDSLPAPAYSYARLLDASSPLLRLDLRSDSSSTTNPATAPAAESPPLRVHFTEDLGYNSAIDPVVLAGAKQALQVLGERGMGAARCDVADATGALSVPDMGLDWAMVMGAQEWAMTHEALQARDPDLLTIERGFARGFEFTSRTGIAQFEKTYRKLHALNDALGRIFEDCDILAMPALPIQPFAAEGPMPDEASPGNKFTSPLHPVFGMYPFNFSGHPACVLRAPGHGPGRGAPPAALQLVARRHCDDLLLRVAHAYERASGCFVDWPDLEQMTANQAAAGPAQTGSASGSYRSKL